MYIYVILCVIMRICLCVFYVYVCNAHAQSYLYEYNMRICLDVRILMYVYVRLRMSMCVYVYRCPCLNLSRRLCRCMKCVCVCSVLAKKNYATRPASWHTVALTTCSLRTAMRWSHCHCDMRKMRKHRMLGRVALAASWELLRAWLARKLSDSLSRQSVLGRSRITDRKRR